LASRRDLGTAEVYDESADQPPGKRPRLPRRSPPPAGAEGRAARRGPLGRARRHDAGYAPQLL